MARTDYLKPVKELEFDFVDPDCPVTICKGKIMSDVETHKLYISLVYKNMSKKLIDKMSVQLWLYDSDKANLPYMKLPLDYDLNNPPQGFYTAMEKYTEHIAQPGNKFGREYYFSLPESYFVRMAVVIRNVHFTDGEEYIGNPNAHTLPFNKMDTDFDEFEKKAYQRINIYSKLEKKHPGKVVPMAGEHFWVCCCGEKNHIDSDKCSVCERERQWQMENLSKEAVSAHAQVLREEKSADVALLAKLQSRKNAVSTLEQKELDKRRREIEEAQKNVLRQQRASDARKKWAIALVFLWILICVVVISFSRA